MREILETLKAEGSPQWSARDFEARVRSLKSDKQAVWEHSVFRVRADKYAIGNHWFQHPLKRRIVLQCIHLFRLGGYIIGGNRLRDKVDEKIKIYQDYLNGPYPMYWSGLMNNGKVHDNMIRFLELIHKSDLVQSFKSRAESRQAENSKVVSGEL